MEDKDKSQAFARQIATAVFSKLKMEDKYTVTIRRHAEIVPFPWIDIAFCKIGKNPQTDEYTLTLPERRYLVDTKEERSELATIIFRNVMMMLGLDKKA
jgi:hypothetical protein